MFNLFGNKLDQEIDKLTATYEKRIDQLNKQIKDLRDSINDAKKDDVATSTFVADFEAMNAFSVERNVSNSTNEVCTVIGFILKEPFTTTNGDITEKDVVREWYFYCSKAQHEKLVREFEQYRDSKKETK